MDFLRGSIKQFYFKYLAAAFGSAMITSIYSIVDMAMVGQYQGPDGTAAPVWNIIYSLGLLTGIGGSVVFSIERGSSAKRIGSENQYFTVAVIGSIFWRGWRGRHCYCWRFLCSPSLAPIKSCCRWRSSI